MSARSQPPPALAAWRAFWISLPSMRGQPFPSSTPTVQLIVRAARRQYPDVGCAELNWLLVTGGYRCLSCGLDQPEQLVGGLVVEGARRDRS
jgi:hypothetical protein